MKKLEDINDEIESGFDNDAAIKNGDCLRYLKISDYEFMMPWSMEETSSSPKSRKDQIERLTREACILQTRLRHVKARIRNLEAINGD